MNIAPKHSETNRHRGFAAVIAAGMAFFGCLPFSARATEPPSSNTQSHGTAPISAALPPATAANVSSNGFINSMDTLDDRHKLNIGDRVSFRIVEDEDDPKEIAVTVSGDMEIPYLGRYPVVGQTCKDVAWKLKAEFEKKYYYHATVILAVNEWARSQGKVYIVGPVHLPGPQEIPSDEVFTLSKAILRAGGFGDYAERHKVEVRRKSATPGGKDQVFTVDVTQILEKGKTDADLPLEGGDVIYVPERLVRF